MYIKNGRIVERQHWTYLRGKRKEYLLNQVIVNTVTKENYGGLANMNEDIARKYIIAMGMKMSMLPFIIKLLDNNPVLKEHYIMKFTED
jgi:hypothetical protein